MKKQSWNGLPKLSSTKTVQLTGHHLPNSEEFSPPYTAYGNGRSYGDVCLADHGTMLVSRSLDRFIHFDREAGILKCEAGVTLEEILNLVVPQGWFIRSTPGTRYVTVAGALANDVHGKNHHDFGCFGHHVLGFELVRSSGERLECRPDKNEGYFKATIGGLGLTGLVTWVEIQLMRVNNPWMWVQSQRFSGLEEFWELNAQAEKDWPYTVAWIDCLAKGESRGRGILLSGKHATHQENLPVYKEGNLTVPLQPPISLINNLSLKSFNALYYRQPVKPQGSLQHYIPYFYPLDGIKKWNRIYGSKGFYQYQCVLPPETAKEGIADLLEAIAQSGQGSFLAVLKTFGEIPSIGMLSFPRPGTTLALDFPNRGDKTLELFKELDAVVTNCGGALYPAKDARMPASLFQSGYPQWEAFSEFVDPDFSSHFWERVSS